MLFPVDGIASKDLNLLSDDIQTWDSDSMPSTSDEDAEHFEREPSSGSHLIQTCTPLDTFHLDFAEDSQLVPPPQACATNVRGGLARALARYASPMAPVEVARNDSSVFSGSVRRIRFLSASGAMEAERFVHESVLMELPYFEAMLARWDFGDAGDVRLPDGCDMVAVDALLSRLYSRKVVWAPPDWARALGPGIHTACAAMLLVKFFLAEALVQEIVPLIRQRTTDEQSRAWLATSRALCDVEELQDLLDDGDAAGFVGSVDPKCLLASIVGVLQQPVDERTLMARALLDELLDQRFG